MEELFLSGSQIATYSTLNGQGNGTDRVVTLTDVEAVGTSDQIFRIVINQINDDSTQFDNGQIIEVFNPDGTILFSTNTVQPDAEQGAAAGDDYLIFTQGGNFVFDLNGFPSGSTTQTFTNDTTGQNGDPDIGDNDGQLDFADVAVPVVCFTPDVKIDTGAGPRLIQDLRPGDTVKDVDGADVAILWIGSRHVTFSGDNAPRPILISTGAIGHNCPSSDLMVSPQHRMRLTGTSVRSVFGEDHVLAPARGLTSLRGIREMKGKTSVTYVALLLTRHAVLRANGAATESLYPGPQALRALPSFQRQLVYRAVPGLAAEGVAAAYGPPAHRLLKVQESRAIAQVMKADVEHQKLVS